MLIAALFLALAFVTSLYSAPYTLCIDGGGSKTTLQVLDVEGRVLPLDKEGVVTDLITAPASNPNTVGLSGVEAAFLILLNKVKIANDNHFLSYHLPECSVIAGMAGATSKDNLELVLSIMEGYGLQRGHITLMNDGELALQLVGDRGAILISGTGSVCFAKNHGTIYQVGGLGPVLGDEGSGYHIAKEALKLGLAHEYGWGESTLLTQHLKHHFEVESLKSLVRPICSGDIKPAAIAAAAPVVFDAAFLHHDPLAKDLVDQEVKHLAYLIASGAHMADLKNCEVHLWGGTFMNPYASKLISLIEQNGIIQERKLTIVNNAHANAAILYALKHL